MNTLETWYRMIPEKRRGADRWNRRQDGRDPPRPEYPRQFDPVLDDAYSAGV